MFLKTTLFIIVNLLCFTQLQARRGMPVGNVEKIRIVKDLPDTDDYKGESGEYLDLAERHTDFVMLFFPVYVDIEPELVLASPDNLNTYYTMDEAIKKDILNENNIEESDVLGVGWWSRWGGKVFFLLFLAAVIYFINGRSGDPTPRQV